MIPKINRGNGFRGVLDYALKKEKGHLIGGNMIGENPRELAMEFGITRKLDESIKNPVWHCSLALDPGEELNDDQWRKVTSEYMKDLGFTENHQFCVVKHEDTDHSHVHIIASRIGGNFELYKGHRDGLKAGAVCSKIELEYDLSLVDRRRSHKKHLGESLLSQLDKKLGVIPTKRKTKAPTLTKNEREMQKRTGKKAARLVAYEAVNKVLKENEGLTLEDFIAKLEEHDVRTRIKKYQNSEKVQGLSFEHNGVPFKAKDLNQSWKSIQGQLINKEQVVENERTEKLRRTLRDLHGRTRKAISDVRSEFEQYEDNSRERVGKINELTIESQDRARSTKERDEEYQINHRWYIARCRAWIERQRQDLYRRLNKRIQGFQAVVQYKISRLGSLFKYRSEQPDERRGRRSVENDNSFSNIRMNSTQKRDNTDRPRFRF